MHKSVLYDEVINGLNINPNGIYIDATLGYGGHSSGVLGLLNEKGFLFAFDQDEDAIEYSKLRLSKISNNFKIIKSNFKDMNKYIDEQVDGIMFDLGVSSPQLDQKERGFSYKQDAPLDMRMDKDAKLSAYEVVNNYSLEKLIDIFFIYGEEMYSKAIAKNIVNNRPINTTLELAEIIKNSVPEKYRNKSHPARKVFQAIRIEVNKEIEILEDSILNAFELLKPHGRLCVITFHSLEDRIVKNVFNKLSSDNNSLNLPFIPDDMRAKAKLITRKPIVPSEEELKNNNRSRSAKLRINENIGRDNDMQKRKVCLLKGEKFLYFVIGLLVICNLLAQAFSSAMLSKTNIEVESVKSKITKQEKLNESLSMKINELSSLDKIESVATSFGLEYNNNNIKIISE